MTQGIIGGWTAVLEIMPDFDGGWMPVMNGESKSLSMAYLIIPEENFRHLETFRSRNGIHGERIGTAK